MASFHTMSSSKSSFKSRRLESVVKALVFRSIATSRADRNTYIQSSSQHRMLDEKNAIIEQFRLHRESCDLLSIDDVESNEKKTRRRISYTKEQKLEAISYAIIT